MSVTKDQDFFNVKPTIPVSIAIEMQQVLFSKTQIHLGIWWCGIAYFLDRLLFFLFVAHHTVLDVIQ